MLGLTTLKALCRTLEKMRAIIINSTFDSEIISIRAQGRQFLLSKQFFKAPKNQICMLLRIGEGAGQKCSPVKEDIVLIILFETRLRKKLT